MLARIIKIVLLMLLFVGVAGVSTYLTVHLFIRSRDTVVVPNLETKEVVYALEVLTDLGLNTKVKKITFNPTVPKHHIIAQDPEAGTEIKHGRDVRLVISRGPRTVIIPNLAGLNLAQANIIIDQNGLEAGTLSHVYHNAIPQKEVVAQFPLSNSSRVRGDTIDLLVSGGRPPEMIPMMDLTGIGLNDAIDRIEQNGLRVGAISIENQPNLTGDIVLGHAPEAGYPVLRGNPIGLTINRHTQNSETQRRHSSLFRYRAPQGFLRQQVRVKVSQQASAYDIFNGFLAPGKEIWLSIPRNASTTLFLYVDGELLQTEHY